MSKGIKHYIDENDIYKIYIDNNVKLQIKLDKELNQIQIITDKEVWSGPIELLSLSNI